MLLITARLSLHRVSEKGRVEVVWNNRITNQAIPDHVTSPLHKSLSFLPSCLVSLVPPPFPQTSRLSLLSDHRLSSNRTLGSSGSSADSQARIASRGSGSSRRPQPLITHQLGSVRNSIASQEMAMLYIGRFCTFSISPFHLRLPFSPFYTFTFTLDVAFDHRQTLLRPRRFRPRRREPLIIFLCLRTWSTTCLSRAAPYPSSLPFFSPLARLRS